MNIDLRKDCRMRHENGNCTVAGGFCTAVSDPICEALHNAYNSGYFDGEANTFKWYSKRFDLESLEWRQAKPEKHV